MRPLRYSINVTLDGCCDHRAILPTPELHRHAAEGLAQTDVLLFGRATYELMEAGWRTLAQATVAPPGVPDWMLHFARTMDAAKKLVVSDTLDTVDWNAELVRGHELLEVVRRLRQQPGRGIALGGIRLARVLAEAGLIDAYEFIVHARVAGHGPTLLAGLAAPVDLRLVDQVPVGPSAVAMRYVPVR